MVKLIILVGIFIASHGTHGGSIDRNTSDLAKDLEKFRKTLVDLPDAFFDLELTMHNSDDLDTEEDDPLFGDVTNFRKQLAGLAGELQDELFDIELTVNNLLVEEGGTDDDDKDDDDKDDDDKDDDDKDDDVGVTFWYLGMNLNPEDGHIMDYCTGWGSSENYGEYTTALSQDYKNQAVWEMPANYIAIVRHQNRHVDAVKVFRFSSPGQGISLSNRFASNYRDFVTSGGPVQESVDTDAQYMDDDPIFSVGGDLAFNWGYSNNGHRIVMTGGHLSPEGSNDMNTHGLGNNYACRPTYTNDTVGCLNGNYNWRHEISVIQDCDWADCKVYREEGTDHSPDRDYYQSGPVYGNYAIYVSNGTSFPEPGYYLYPLVEW